MIPKKLHVIWIGDDSKRPDRLLKTWQDKHPDWEYKIWGNKELNDYEWLKQSLMDVYLKETRYPGVADVMRYNILLNEGGFVHPADSECLHNIEPLIDCTALGVYENETVRPGLISPLYGAIPNHPLTKAIIDRLPDTPPLAAKGTKERPSKAPWQVTGNAHMQRVVESQNWQGLKILPSYVFNPVHHTGHTYKGTGKIYAKQLWGATFDKYGKI
jgi:mannosyltransferase OCH1-like enzyme